MYVNWVCPSSVASSGTNQKTLFLHKYCLLHYINILKTIHYFLLDFALNAS